MEAARACCRPVNPPTTDGLSRLDLVSCDVVEALFVLFTDNEGQGSIQKWTITDKGPISSGSSSLMVTRADLDGGGLRAVNGPGALHQKGPRIY